MALSNEEREALFATITESEEIEGRAEAILNVRVELNEETENRVDLENKYKELESKYTKNQEEMIKLLHSIPQSQKNNNGGNADPTPPNTLMGFAKLKGG